MNLTERYTIDRSIMLQKSYRLLCTFFANKEIARRSDPGDENAPLSTLESMFSEREASQLLLELAIGIRVLDDQMGMLSSDAEERRIFYEKKQIVDKYEYELFDDLGLDLRETCNKIIHSDVMEPHRSSGTEAHADDLEHIHGEGERTIDWDHLNGYVRLAGKHKGNEWSVLLNVEMFVRAIFVLLEYQREST